MSASHTNWIAVDWGTSNLRCWVFDQNNDVLKQLTSDKGMGELEPHQFESTLLSVVEAFLPKDKTTPIIACGMVGAKQGWQEATYAKAPCAPHSSASMLKAKVNDPRIEVHILPGISSANPPDVMRGEETQLAGFLSSNPNFNGAICLPGTHAKWVNVEENKIAEFTTCMTGELFAVISNETILRHSLQKGWNQQAFEKGVSQILSNPESLSAQLFKIRVEYVLQDAAKDAAYSKLSGMLLGSELAATRNYWQGKKVELIGSETLCAPYASALKLAGVEANISSGDTMVLEGLKSAYSTLKSQNN
ncbi:MAG: 2-dehydro-3-deoxygalactonokinase [Nitratireductor sp.]